MNNNIIYKSKKQHKRTILIFINVKNNTTEQYYYFTCYFTAEMVNYHKMNDSLSEHWLLVAVDDSIFLSL